MKEHSEHRSAGGHAVENEAVQLREDLRQAQLEIERLNAELQETNRGVMALYSELDDRAEDLRRASEMKSRFLSSISHELRTPLTSVLNITRLLLDRLDGDLTGEQERQVRLIRQSVTNLMEMVNDLLDLARIEAGMSVLQLGEVKVTELIATMRGMFRPLVSHETVPLIFEDVEPALVLCTDEGKLSQILRNFISNALKFTWSGEIRVRTQLLDEEVTFSVQDTGIGIAPELQEHLFKEFYQIPGRHQIRSRGTGLGLSISKRIAGMLGGQIELHSEPDVGSTFSLRMPRVHPLAPMDGCTGSFTQEVSAQVAPMATGSGDD